MLDFLIRRYGDSPEARAPAPAGPKPEFQMDRRAIVVHHHVWAGKVGGTKTREEAEALVSSILQRMRCPGKSRLSLREGALFRGAKDDYHPDSFSSPSAIVVIPGRS